MNDAAPNYKLTRFACYAAYFTMSSVFCLPPILFVTLQEMYGISYTLLGTLVLTNFCTQLAVDLIFTLFSKHFNVRVIVKIMPLITSAGLVIYALVPTFFPDYAYVGLLVGTIVFSAAAGLSEVLLSPTISALPSEHPQRDMSMLHSLYAFGVVTIVGICALFLNLFGNRNWMYLTLILAALPILAAVLFMLSPMPDMMGENTAETAEKAKTKTLGLALCAACIFFGSCAENTMSNWISSYMENALHINKTLGDIFGTAMFAVLLGAMRVSYAKFGKNISRVLLVGMVGATACYLVAGLSTGVTPAFLACILTGLFTAMLWPGTLIMMEENLPGAGVAAYALMAAAGDFGASVAPQMMGILVDQVSASDFAVRLSETMNLSVDQVGMKVGMLVSAIFPILGTVLILYIIRYFKKQRA